MHKATFQITDCRLFNRALHDKTIILESLLATDLTASLENKSYVKLIHAVPSTHTNTATSTHIYTLGTRYNLVILVDVSPSMSTIGAVGKPKSLFSVAFETICKCIDGVTRQFNPTDETNADSTSIITPEIYVTVIADHSSTFSYESHIPHSNHSTNTSKQHQNNANSFTATNPFKVLIQEFHVNAENFDIFTEGLYDAINDFENKSVQSRKLANLNMQKRTSAIVTDLKSDLVSNNDSKVIPMKMAHSRSESSTISITSQQLTSATTITRKKSITQSDTSDDRVNSSRGSLYASLEYVLYFIKNASQDKLQAVILISDGVASGTNNSEEMTTHDYCRRITKEFASFTVIQIGCPQGFYPAVNYGHVPDPEYLKFLAVATSGHFLYSTDCHYIYSDHSFGVPGPNFYHSQILIRHTIINKTIDENSFQNVHYECVPRLVDTPVTQLSTIIEGSDDLDSPNCTRYTTTQERRFPWNLNSIPPKTSLLLFSLHKYSLYAPALSFVINARLLEGYTLYSVQHFMRPNKSPKLDIIFILPWLPHITIFYRVRCHQSQLLKAGSEGQIKPPRVELNLMAPSQFTLILMNLEKIQSNPNRLADCSKLPIYNSVLKLQQYIRGIIESDYLFKTLAQRKEDLSHITINSAQYDTHTLEQSISQIDQLIERRALSFQEETIYLILRSTSFTRPGGINHANSPVMAQDKTRRQVATLYLLEHLMQWSSFHIGKHIYMKHVNGAKGLIYLKVIWENDFVVNLTMTFISIPHADRIKHISELTDGLNCIEHINRGLPFRLIIVCTKMVNQYVYGPNSDQIPHLNCYGIFKRWKWFPLLQVDNFDDETLYDSARHWITYHRLSEGFVPIFESATKILFYNEIKIMQNDGKEIVCSSLFSIRCDFSTRLFDTRLWMEPYFVLKDGKSLAEVTDTTLFLDMYQLRFDSMAELIEQRDRNIIDRLYTFIYLKHAATNSIDNEPQIDTQPTCNDSLDSEKIECNFDMKQVIEHSQIYCIKFRIPSTETYSAFFNFLSENIAQSVDFKFKDSLLFEKHLVSVYEDLDKKLESIEKFVGDRTYFAKVICDETILIISIKSREADSDSQYIQCTLFLVQYPSVSPRSIVMQSSIAFTNSVTKSQEKFQIVPLSSQENKCQPILSLFGSFKVDINQKSFNMRDNILLLENLYKKSVIQTNYFALISKINIPIAASFRSALDSCARVCIDMDISDFLRLTPIDSSSAYQEVLSQTLNHLDFVGSSTYYLRHDDDDVSFDRNFDLSRDPFFLTIEICLFLPDDQTAHFDLSSTEDISHIRDNFSNFIKGVLQFTWKCCSLPHKKTITADSFKGLIKECSEFDVSKSMICHLESTYVHIRKYLDEEILYSMLYKDLKSMSLRFISDMISRLSDTLPTISRPSEVALYIQDHPNMQTFCGRIEPIFLCEQSVGFLNFFVNFFFCKCFVSTRQLGSSYVLKFGRHDDATDGVDYWDFECDEPFTLADDKYWLILSNNGPYLDVHFYARNMKTKTSFILQLLINRIFRMIKKVNQRVLVNDLCSTKRASKLLIKDIEGSSSIEESEEDDEFEELYMKHSNVKVNPGDFACPELFVYKFPIHWRLKSSNVLNSIMSSLQPVAISNKKNMLIFSTEKSVTFYIELSITEQISSFGQSLNLINEDAQALTESIPATDTSPNSNPHLARRVSDLVTPTSTIQSSICKTYSSETFLLIRVFGVDGVTKESREGLVTLIESKISALLQNVISTYLSRNLSSKLTTSDVEFILPVPKKPFITRIFEIPSLISNPYLLMMCLKQKILCYMNSLSGSEVNTALVNYIQDGTGFSTLFWLAYYNFKNIMFSETDSYEQHVGDLSFIYSAVSTRTPSVIESSFGLGIASLYIVIVDSKGKVMVDVPSNLTTNASSSQIFDEHYSFKMEMWKIGNINAENICLRIEQSFQASIIECQIEHNLQEIDTSMKDLTLFRRDITNLLEQGLGLPDSVFYQLKSEVYLPLWLSKIFVMELKGLMETVISGIQVLMNFTAIDELKSDDPEVEYTSFTGVIEILGMQSRAIPDSSYNTTIADLSSNALMSANSSPQITSKLIEDCGSDTSLNSSVNALRSANQLPKKQRYLGIIPSHLNTTSRISADAPHKIFDGYFDPAEPSLGKRKYVVNISIKDTQIVVKTYNLSKNYTNKLFEHLIHSLSWNNIRIKFLKKYSPISSMINIGNLTIPREIKPISSSYHGIYDPVRKNELLNEARRKESDSLKDSNMQACISYESLYSMSSDSLQRSLLDFLPNYISMMSDAIPELVKLLLNIPISFSFSESVPRTPKTKNVAKQEAGSLFDKGVDIGSELIKVERTLQVESFFKYPILFSENRCKLFNDLSQTATCAADPIRFKALLNQWYSLFAAYLRFLKFEELDFNADLLENTTTGVAFNVNETLSIPVSPKYFSFNITGGVLIVQAAVDDIFATSNAYSLRFYKEDHYLTRNQNHPSEFHVAVTNQKKRIHFHSLCYDFHIRVFQQLMDEAPVPTSYSINVLEVMHSFLKFNTQKAPFARCRIMHHILKYDNLVHMDTAIRSYIFSNPEKYGYQPLLFKNEVIACYMTTTSPLFQATITSSSPFSHTLVIYPNNSKDSVELACFVLILDNMNMFPDETDKGLLGEHEEEVDEYMHSGYYLLDILKNGIKQVDSMIEKATQSYSRDSLWDEMKNLSLSSFDISNIRDSRWTSMLIEKLVLNSQSLVIMHKRLTSLFSDSRVPWGDILEYLKIKMSGQTLCFTEEGSVNKLHLIVMNADNRDYLLHFTYQSSNVGQFVSCRAVSREGIPSEVETQHIDSVIRIISTFLFEHAASHIR